MPSRDATFARAVLDFLRKTGTERSTGRVVAEMFRFFAETFSFDRVTLFLARGPDRRMEPFVSEYADGSADPALYDEWRALDPEKFPLMDRIRDGVGSMLVTDPFSPTDGLPPEVVQRYDIQPFVVFALSRDGELIGVLMVEGDVDTLRRHQSETAELADHVTTALANARAFEDEHRRASDAEALLEVASVLTKTTELTSVLAAVAQNAARVAHFDRCSVFLVDEATGALQPTMSQFADGHVDEAAWERFVGTRFEVPLATAVMRSGMPQVIDDPENQPDQIPIEWVAPFGIKTMLFVPLSAWGQSFGVLVLDRRRRDRIGAKQIRVAQGVASQGAAAIGIARLLARERAAIARLEELDRLKTTFVAAVSHELRTPLTSIIGFGAILADHVHDDEGKEFVSLIHRESAHLESLINNLLVTSRLEAGLLRYERCQVDVGSVIEEAAELVRTLYPHRSIELNLEPDLVIQEGDAGRLRQVFVNLLQNAAKYTPQESPVEVSIRRDTESGLVVRVDDRGDGIPEEEREAIFDRFRRGRDQTVQGTGIGLYLVRTLVEAHGGRVWVEARPDGPGARFVVTLPVFASSAEMAWETAAERIEVA